MISAQEAFNEMINLLNCQAWYPTSEAHIVGRKAENIITKYLQEQVQLERSQQEVQRMEEHRKQQQEQGVLHAITAQEN